MLRGHKNAFGGVNLGIHNSKNAVFSLKKGFGSIAGIRNEV